MIRKHFPVIFFMALVAVATVGFFGCKGEDGEDGAQGPPGVNPPRSPIINAVIASPDSVGMRENITVFVSAYDPNGDAINYSWSASAGTLSSTNRAVTVWTAPSQMGLFVIRVTVSDQTGSARDSVVVGVNTYLPAVFPSYLGDNPNRCSHCHGAIMETWHNTGHAEAYQTLVAAGAQNNPYCVQCHVTGYDTRVNSDGSIAQQGVDNGGYDDFPTAMLEGVQCEACHGPTGPEFANHAPDRWPGQTGEACARCHEHQDAEWRSDPNGNQIGHGQVLVRETREEMFAEWGRTDCNYCHISEGFLKKWDPDWARFTLNAENVNMIGCATCHDQHGNGNPGNLRVMDTVFSPYSAQSPRGYVISNLGAGQLCAHCHHARRDSANIAGQINRGTPRPGPHESPQADMVLGQGSYEIPGFTYERESPHVSTRPGMEDVCVRCHMFTIPFGQPGGPIAGHSFAPDVRTCNSAECHAGLSDFNFRNRQTEFDNLLSQLAALLPHDTAGNVRSTMDTLNWTRPQREAGYAYFFARNDGSRGIHNVAYSRSLLQNAIAHLTASAAMKEEREQY